MRKPLRAMTAVFEDVWRDAWLYKILYKQILRVNVRVLLGLGIKFAV